MGRRHFDYTPNVRAVQESLVGEACFVDPEAPGKRPPFGVRPSQWTVQDITFREEPVPWSPARRLFPDRDGASTGGATPSTSVGKRPVSSPASSRIEPSLTRKKHYGNNESEPGDVANIPGGPHKRHFAPSAGHVSGVGSVVTSCDASPSNRKHGAGGATTQKQSWERPQRRHLTVEDNLLGSSVYEAFRPANDGSRPRSGSRSGRTAFQSSGGVSQAIHGELVHHTAAWDSSTTPVRAESRPRSSGRRSIHPNDSLIGGSVVGAPPTFCAPASVPGCISRRPPLPRRPGTPSDHLWGGIVNHDPQHEVQRAPEAVATSRRYSSPGRRQDTAHHCFVGAEAMARGCA